MHPLALIHLLEQSLDEVHYTDVWPGGFPALIKKWRGKKNQRDLYVQFTDHGDNTLARGIHQDPDHSDMAAVYAYPLKYVVDYPADIWYGFNSKFVRVLQDRSRRTCLLSSLDWGDVNTILYRMGIPRDHIDIAKRKYKDRAKGVTAPGKILMSCVQMAIDKGLEGEDGPFKKRDYGVRSSTDQSALFMKAGFDAVEDAASRITQASINDREPHQIAFLRPQAFKVLDIFRMSDPQRGGKVSVSYDRLGRKIAAQLAAVMGDKIAEGEVLGRTFWTKGGREIHVGSEDSSIRDRMNRLKIGQRDFKKYRKHTPERITASVKSERGEFRMTAFDWESVSEILDSFKSKWAAAPGDNGERYSKGRKEQEEKDRQAAHWAAELQKEIQRDAEGWPGTRASLVKVAQGMGTPLPPELDDPAQIHEYLHTLTHALRYQLKDNGESDFIEVSKLLGEEVHPSHIGFLQAANTLKPDFKSITGLIFKYRDKMEPNA